MAIKSQGSPFQRSIALFTLAVMSLLVPFSFSQAPVSKPVSGSPVVNPQTIQPSYPVPYGKMTVEEITKVLDRIRVYLDSVTTPRLINQLNGEEIKDLSNPGNDAIIERGSFGLISYEWGVTYAGMLLAGEATGDSRFTDYTARRLQFIARLVPFYQAQLAANPQAMTPLRPVLSPGSLDDSGSMCAAMIKAYRAGVGQDLKPLIDNYIQYISSGQFRLKDGTLARTRPLPDSLWLDDLFMSVPALAQMGKLTGERRYYDDAVKQILQFSQRMFVREKGLYMHGWIAGMDVHPAFLWARANGWALMAMVELLDVLPEDHPGRSAVLDLLRMHIRGLAGCQSGAGLWHQLLDRDDSYLETSASAIYVYCIARAINRGWIDPLAYGPMVQLAWNAVTTKVNAEGQVEGTCVGTGLEFNPTFYYYRPTSVYAAHGYGPVLLAGAEMIRLSNNHAINISDGALQIK